MAGHKILAVMKDKYCGKRKQLSPATNLGAKIGSKEGGSFQLNQVQDGFWDARPPARRGITSLRLGERFQLFFDGRIVSLVKFSKQDSGFDNKFKSTA